MDFIGYFEFDPKDFDDIIPLFQKAMAVREKEPDKFPTIEYGPVSMAGGWKGFSIYHDPTSEQMNAIVIHYMPYMTFKFVNISPAPKMIEQYLKTKK
jgi:hypothetical protein